MLYKNSPKSFSKKKNFFCIVTKKYAKKAFLRELSLNDFFFFCKFANFLNLEDFGSKNPIFTILKFLQKKKNLKSIN